MATKRKVTKRNKALIKKVTIKEIVTDTPWEVLRKAMDIYQHSETSHYVNRLNEVVNEDNYKMSQWEVDQLNDFISKFSAKYNSPLAKALK